MVAEVLGFETFQNLVGIDADAAPFLMDEVGEDGVFIAFLDVVRGPIVGEFVAGFLPGHALLNPLVAAAMLLPGGAGAFEGTGGVGHFLHPLVADAGEPEFDRLGLGAGNALDEAQEGLGIGDVGEAHFTVVGGQFEPVTICHQLTSLFVQALSELVPVFSGGLVIGLLGEYLDDVHDGEEPSLGLFVVEAADSVSLKNGQVFFHNGGWIFFRVRQISPLGGCVFQFEVENNFHLFACGKCVPEIRRRRAKVEG